MHNTRTALRAFLIITLSTISLIGCGGDSETSNPTTPDPTTSNPTTPDSTASSNWDQMEWDKGTWSN